MTKLEGKSCLISGSGRGIGRSIALKLASEGARVGVNDLDAAPGDAAVAEIQAAGGDAVAASMAACRGRLRRSFCQHRGRTFRRPRHHHQQRRLHPGNATIQKMTDEQFQAMLDVPPWSRRSASLRAASEPIHIFAKKEAEAGKEVFRKVVNISSIAGPLRQCRAGELFVGQGLLVGLTRTLCKEWGRYKVNVNCVAFGLINTRLTQPIEAQQKTIDVAGRDIKVGVQPQMLDAMARMIPLTGAAARRKRRRTRFICSAAPESNYISGQVVVCGGGLLFKKIILGRDKWRRPKDTEMEMLIFKIIILAGQPGRKAPLGRLPRMTGWETDKGIVTCTIDRPDDRGAGRVSRPVPEIPAPGTWRRTPKHGASAEGGGSLGLAVAGRDGRAAAERAGRIWRSRRELRL